MIYLVPSNNAFPPSVCSKEHNPTEIFESFCPWNIDKRLHPCLSSHLRKLCGSRPAKVDGMVFPCFGLVVDENASHSSKPRSGRSFLAFPSLLDRKPALNLLPAQLDQVVLRVKARLLLDPRGEPRLHLAIELPARKCRVPL